MGYITEVREVPTYTELEVKFLRCAHCGEESKILEQDSSLKPIPFAMNIGWVVVIAGLVDNDLCSLKCAIKFLQSKDSQ